MIGIIFSFYIGLGFDCGYVNWDSESGRNIGFINTYTGENIFLTYSFDYVNLSNAHLSFYYTRISPGLKLGEKIWIKGNINIEYLFWFKSYDSEIYPSNIWNFSVGGEISFPIGFRIGIEGIYRFLLNNLFNVSITFYIPLGIE